MFLVECCSCFDEKSIQAVRPHALFPESTRFLSLERLPLAAPALAKLRDATRRDIETLRSHLCRMILRQEPSHRAVAIGQMVEELREVNTERRCNRWRRNSVVPEPFIESVEISLSSAATVNRSAQRP